MDATGVRRMSARHMGATEWGLLGFLSVLWGGSFFFAKVALHELAPLPLVLARVGLAALALGLVLAGLRQALPTGRRVWLAFAGMGFLNNLVPFSLIFWGQTALTAGHAAILNATTPLFTVLVAHLATRDERLTAGKLSGVLLGLGGVVVLVGPAALTVDRAFWAQLACLGAALSYACAGVFGRRFRQLGVTPLQTAFGQLIMTTAMLALPVLWQSRGHIGPLPGPTTLMAVAGLALASTALAYVIFFRLLATAGATNLLLVTFLIPVSAILLGSGLLGEALTAGHVAGMALIGLGLAAIDGRPLEALSRRLRPARAR